MERAKHISILAVLFAAVALTSGCPADGTQPYVAGLTPIINVGPPETPYTIKSSDSAIGGPLAQARIGDQLLQNDQVRVVIQQPGKYPGVGSFGGNIIDADRVRNGAPGRDEFGVMLPMINVEWTVNGTQMFAVKDFDPETFDPDNLEKSKTMEKPPATEPQILIVRGIIDTYDYLDIDFLEPVAKAITGQSLYFSPRFDDASEPFKIYDLKDLKIDVVTSYRLDPGSRAVKITTTLLNDGDAPVKLPVGDFLNGSGELEMLIPGQGFTPPLVDQIQNDTPSLLYVGMPWVNVSYGYFFDLSGYTQKKSTSLSYSGVTGVLLGEEFTRIFPLGGGKTPTINFEVPAHGRRTFTRYLVIGDGSAGSLMDEGIRLLKTPHGEVGGVITDRDGNGVSGANVALLNNKGATVVTYRSGGKGEFRGLVANGTYAVRVDKPGFSEPGTGRAGTCAPETISVGASGTSQVKCALGESGIIAFGGAVTDAASGSPMPARVTIVGFDPSADNKAPGIFHDQTVFERPYGVVDVIYLNANGAIGLTDATSMRLEPGHYIFFFTHGPEYSAEEQVVDVPGYGITEIAPVTLRKVIATPGFIGADFHIHALPSPDSSMAPEQRVLAAAAEGLDVLHSSDHDFLFDYAPVVSELEAKGIIIPGAMGTIVGDEISPNSLGHIHAFPLVPDPSRPNNGALDWSISTHDRVGPDPDFMMTVQEIIDAIKQSPGGEKVIQVNHISDRATSLFLLTGLVTTAAYRDSHHVEPLSTYTDPSSIRVPPLQMGTLPLPMGGGVLFSPQFSAAELSIGGELNTNLLRESSLPQWFNLLNLGLIVTATSDSDSHTPVAVPLGTPRNYVASTLDPADGKGPNMYELDRDAYAKAINEHRVIVSAGPFIRMEVRGENGAASIGGIIRTQKPVVRVEVTSPEWAWFDTIEIYANTIPSPVDDDDVGILRGVASDPAQFDAPYHIPKFVYEPAKVFRLSDGTLKEWKRENGVIHAVVETPLTVDHDTWVVAFVRGTADTQGFRPLFPYIPHSHVEEGKEPELPAKFTLQDFYADPSFNVPAWAFTNPVFIDVDGDTNSDGNPFEAIYVKQGTSPL